ncbi:hypothetical protein GY12_17325 [Micrococcus luteus]|nr:hypothetical protein GY12_17325 [Micrococcus luteus]
MRHVRQQRAERHDGVHVARGGRREQLLEERAPPHVRLHADGEEHTHPVRRGGLARDGPALPVQERLVQGDRRPVQRPQPVRVAPDQGSSDLVVVELAVAHPSRVRGVPLLPQRAQGSGRGLPGVVPPLEGQQQDRGGPPPGLELVHGRRQVGPQRAQDVVRLVLGG